MVLACRAMAPPGGCSGVTAGRFIVCGSFSLIPLRVSSPRLSFMFLLSASNQRRLPHPPTRNPENIQHVFIKTSLHTVTLHVHKSGILAAAAHTFNTPPIQEQGSISCQSKHRRNNRGKTYHVSKLLVCRHPSSITSYISGDVWGSVSDVFSEMLGTFGGCTPGLLLHNDDL